VWELGSCVLKTSPLGHLAGSVSRMCTSWSQRYEFEPHVGRGDYINKNKDNNNNNNKNPVRGISDNAGLLQCSVTILKGKVYLGLLYNI